MTQIYDLKGLIKYLDYIEYLKNKPELDREKKEQEAKREKIHNEKLIQLKLKEYQEYKDDEEGREYETRARNSRNMDKINKALYLREKKQQQARDDNRTAIYKYHVSKIEAEPDKEKKQLIYIELNKLMDIFDNEGEPIKKIRYSNSSVFNP